jgi:octaprenyl-diphosphate synthase
VLDYGGSSATLGKNVGDDFREGKMTLPVVLAYQLGDESERAFWVRTMEKGESSDADLAQAHAILTRHNTLQETLNLAIHYGNIAKQTLDIYPESALKAALLQAVDFCIERKH